MKRFGKILFFSVTLFFVFHVLPVFADSLDQSRTFNVDPLYDYNNRSQIVATLRYISAKGYFYIDDSWWNSLGSYEKTQVDASIKNLANEFDNVIFPKLTNFFGNVWDPGIDNDSHITILMSKLKLEAGGYFDSCNEYKKVQCSHSNEREMIHVNSDFLLDRKIKDFVTHELQHLINWNQKDNTISMEEDVWINEMRSEYVSTLLNYSIPYTGSMLEMRIKNFLANPANPLGEWKGEAGDYGVINLFGQYLANQFGDNIFSLMSKNSFVGMLSINKAFQQAGYSENFDDVFTNWSLANYYNSLAMGSGGKYGYTDTNLKKVYASSTVNGFYTYGMVSFSERIKEWSPRWYLLENKLESHDNSIALKIEFESQDAKANFKVPYIAHFKDGSYDELRFVNLENQKGAAYIFNFAKNVDSILIVPANHSKTTNFTNNDSSTIFTLKASTVVVNQPVISSIYPNKSFASGGNTVTIKGGNFQKGVEVYFGEIKSSNVIFVDENTLTAVVPSHEIGPVNVWIKNLDGKSSVFAGGYEYVRNPIADGSLIRAKGDYRVYIVNGNYKRHILDSRIFSFYGHLGWASIIEVTSDERDSYKTSALVRAAGDKKVYEINGDKTKHWLNMTAEQFSASGRSWDSIFIINNLERDFYKIGANVLFK